MNEKVKNLLRKSEWLIVPVGLVILSFFGGSYYGQKKVLASAKETRDTIMKIVPVYKDFPQPAKTADIGAIRVPVYKFFTDSIDREKTIVLRDTTVQYIYLPREQKYYSEMDGKLRLWVSGYEPRLDRYEFDYPETTITNTVYKKPSRWSFSINAGYGIGIKDGKVVLTPYVGGGISYTLFWL